MKTKKLLLTLALALGFLFTLSSEAYALTPCSGNSVTGNCEFPYAKDGLDSGGTTNTAALVVQSGTLIIGGEVANQELAIGKLILDGGAVTIYDGAKLSLGAKIWLVDADSDGYAPKDGVTNEIVQYIQESAPAGGRRKADMTSTTQVDCDDTQFDVKPSQANFFLSPIPAGGPKAGTYDYNCDNSITKENTNASAYSCNTTGCAAHYYTVVSGWADGSNPICGATEAFYTASYGNCAALSACSYSTSNVSQRCK